MNAALWHATSACEDLPNDENAHVVRWAIVTAFVRNRLEDSERSDG